VLDTIKTLGNQSASISAREAAILQLAAQKELVKKMKCLKAILDIVPNDKVTSFGCWLLFWMQSLTLQPGR
jgi:hypothetical protein